MRSTHKNLPTGSCVEWLKRYASDREEAEEELEGIEEIQAIKIII